MTLARRGTAVLAAAVLLGGCDSLLTVQNPAAIKDEQLNVAQLAVTLANSAQGAFQSNFDDFAYFSAIITDEAVTGHNFIQWKQIDLRQLKDDNDLGTFAQIHQSLYLTDTVAARLKTLLPDAQKNLLVAQSLVYAGYSYEFAGEFLCGTPLKVETSGKIYSPLELSALATLRFDEAITIATAAKAGGSPAASADAVINFAKVGLGRAYLYQGDKPKAAAAVQGVPATFEVFANYSTNTTAQNDVFYGATTGSNRNLGVDVPFRFLGDKRVKHAATPVKGHNNLTDLYTPYAPPSFSSYTGTTNAPFLQNTKIRYASGLEALYIVAEADGPTAATLAFVNVRRAAGGLTAVAVAGDALMSELRTQRSRDFYLDGHRFGDLRRYLRDGVGDFFPSGQHPNDIWGSYGTSTCIPIALDEKNGNPYLGK